MRKALAALDQGVHLLLIDFFPPGGRDPQGIHGALWERLAGEEYRLPPGKDRTLAAYSAGAVKTAYVEPVGVGDSLSEMPLFLSEDFYIQVPLEPAYQDDFRGTPRIYQEVLQV